MSEKSLELEKKAEDKPVVAERPRVQRVYVPRVDIYEAEDSVVLLADMPGVDESTIDITLEKNLLTVKGEVTPPVFDGYELAYAEFRSGNYARSFSLSDGLDRDKIEASVKNGVLQIKLPRAEAARKRKIAVQLAG